MNTKKHRNRLMFCNKKWFAVVASVLLIIAMLTASCDKTNPSAPIDTGATTERTTLPSDETTPATPSESLTTSPSVTTWDRDLHDLIDSLRPPIVSGNSISYAARVIRTNPLSGTVGMSTDPTILNNKDDLSPYLSQAKRGWQFNEDDVEQLLKEFNSDFFHKSVLIVGAIGLNSGSIQVDVKDVIQTDDELTVLFNFIVPDVGTADMMSWHYFVEIAARDATGRTVAKSYLPNVGIPTLEVDK